MENLGEFYILVQFVTLVHSAQTSTKSQAFVLMLSIVSVEVCKLIFLGNLVLLYLVIICFEIVPDYDGLVQYYAVIRDIRF